ncbi:MAG: PIN domain-containing protein [Bacillota bacterium]|nr:PIN domain-containing protein [Bacillota bacterium]
MVPELFVDTSAWVALADSDDQHHRAARETYLQLLARGRLLTTNLVLAESYTLLRRHLDAERALKFLASVRSSPRIEVLYSTRELEAAAEALLRRYSDHLFSYTDAVSFGCMQARGIREAFTFDRHFSVAGFRLVPITP